MTPERGFGFTAGVRSTAEVASVRGAAAAATDTVTVTATDLSSTNPFVVPRTRAVDLRMRDGAGSKLIDVKCHDREIS
jgi:hypothetical protein